MSLQSTEQNADLPSDSWFAGFLDGEGCVTLVRQKVGLKVYYRPVVTAANVNRDCLELFRRRFGGKVYCYGPIDSRHLRSVARWVSQSRIAISAVEQLLPYLVVKKEQAKLLISWYYRPWKARKPCVAYTEAERAADHAAYLELRRLKRVA